MAKRCSIRSPAAATASSNAASVSSRLVWNPTRIGPSGIDVGGDSPQHVRLGARGEEHHDIAGQYRGREGLGLAHRREVELGQVGHQPARPRVIGLGRRDQRRVGVDADDRVPTLVEYGAQSARTAPGVEHSAAGRHHRIDQPSLTTEIGTVGGHRAESLDVPRRVSVLGLRHPSRRSCHADHGKPRTARRVRPRSADVAGRGADQFGLGGLFDGVGTQPTVRLTAKVGVNIERGSPASAITTPAKNSTLLGRARSGLTRASVAEDSCFDLHGQRPRDRHRGRSPRHAADPIGGRECDTRRDRSP